MATDATGGTARGEQTTLDALGRRCAELEYENRILEREVRDLRGALAAVGALATRADLNLATPAPESFLAGRSHHGAIGSG